MKTTVIFHSADYDGIFCREIARRALRKQQQKDGNGGVVVDYIGWDFGQPYIDFPSEGNVILMDLPPDVFVNRAAIDPFRFVWIDHHKSAIDAYADKKFNGIQIDGVAASRLAYQWFMSTEDLVRRSSNMTDREVVSAALPEKEDFLNRRVIEPMAVTLVGEYDVWDHKPSNGDDVTFQFGLDSVAEIEWDTLLEIDSGAARGLVAEMLLFGEAAQACYKKRDADIVTARGFDVEMDGLMFRALNTARCNSQTFEAAIKPHHDGCLAFWFDGIQFNVSLYGVPHKPDLDLSKIAVARGGGGHKQACGFRSPILPWLIPSAIAQEPCFHEQLMKGGEPNGHIEEKEVHEHAQT